jgi:hypothetical protein
VNLEDLVDLESEVWSALQRGDAAADERLLAADFLGVYPSGFAGRSDHVGQLASGPTVAEFTLSDPRMIEISPRDVMLSYRAEWRRAGDTAPGPRASMYVSSLWSLRDGSWINTFSQDSPVDAG